MMDCESKQIEQYLIPINEQKCCKQMHKYENPLGFALFEENFNEFI